MFNTRRKEIYLFHDSETIRFIYYGFLKMFDDVPSSFDDEDWDEIMTNLFNDNHFKQEVEVLLYTIESLIVETIHDKVKGRR